MSVFMVEPEPRTSRIAIAAATALLVLAGGVGFLAGRSSMERADEEVQVSPAAINAIEELRPTESPVLSREDLLTLARKAADAFASGTPLVSDPIATSGRRFDLVIPFGCPGDVRPDGGMGTWSYDEKSATLRVSVSPTQWTASDWKLSEEAGIEAMEGFWIERPWSSAVGCPPTAESQVEDQGKGEAQSAEPPSDAPAEDVPDEQAPFATEHTLAVGQVLLAGEPRGSRRGGRPYEIVRRVQPDNFDPSAGFRLRLIGRIDQLPQGGTVQCVQPNGPAQRPSCFISVELNQVTVENPRTGEVLGTWRSN